MSLPDLSEVVLDALALHAEHATPESALDKLERPLVVASGNALPTGRVLFDGKQAEFCDEGRYQRALQTGHAYDSAVVISASGEKHAPRIVEDLAGRELPTYLLTCSPDSTAAGMLPASRVIATRQVPEPLTYNTSTYMGMMLTRTREDTAAIREHIRREVAPLVAEIGSYDAYYLLVRPEFDIEIPMFVTKFDELFGGRVNGRCYTMSQTLHAKTVVPWDQELFIGFGVDNEHLGFNRLHIPLYEGVGPVGMLAIGYFVIGSIQQQKPRWFAEHVDGYAKRQRELFELIDA